MKKTRATALLLASVMTITSVPSNVMAEGVSVAQSDSATDDLATSSAAIKPFALEGWVSGWSGVSDQAKNVVTTPTADGVNFKITKANNGKFSTSEDSVAYYAYEMPLTADFTLSATMTINSYNALKGTSNPQQSSVGLMLWDDLYSKDNDVTYTSNFMVGTYMAKSASTEASIAATHRYNGTRVVDGDLVGSLPTSTSNGTFEPIEMQIKKVGDVVKVSANGNEYTYNIADLATNPLISYFKDTIYVGFYASRDADVTFSNVNFEVETRTVTGLQLVSAPTKTTYIVGEEMDLSGLEVEAVFSDGSTAVIDDYAVSGFDSDTAGSKTLTITRGSGVFEIPYTVESVTCTKLTITTQPIFTDYYIGQRFSSSAFEATAEYNNGQKATVTADECNFYIDGVKVSDGYYFTKDDVGTKTVVVKHAATDSVAESEVYASYTVEVEDYTLSKIIVNSVPTVRTYAPNDEFKSDGLAINAIYTNAAGENKFAVLDSDEYELLDVDTSSLGTKTITVRYLRDTSLTTTFTITVSEKKAVSFKIRHYPRTTYQVGEDFSTDGMKAYIVYNNDDTDYTEDYTIDLSNFDNTTPGITKVTVVPTNSLFASIDLDVTITEQKSYTWKNVAFGASATLSDNPVTATLDEDGNPIEVNLRSWNGAGKITKDQDGMAYYYTRVNADNNFTITADILVNDYLQYDNQDEKRNGQEAFGIMARDAIPLVPDPDKLDVDDSTSMTVKTEKAMLDENGEPIPSFDKTNFSSNMVLLGGYSGTGWPTDTTALSYQKNATINRINLVMRTGVGVSVEKSGPYKLSDTFPARGNKYKVTLTKIRGGIYAKCYDYTTGEEKETYQYFDDEKDLEFLAEQNTDTTYVGFFAARWADITVSNIELHETAVETDPITSNGDTEATTPAIKVMSPEYTTLTDYNLGLKATNKLGGVVTIQQNGKVIYRDEPVSKLTYLPVTLVPNSVNQFTILYKPSSSDNVTSTDAIVIKKEITQRSSLGDYDVLYCSPDGSVEGDGTRENPLDIYSAVGYVGLGKEVIALDGVYKMHKAFSIPETNSGVAKAWKTLRADDGATVTLDFQNQYEGITLDGYYWHIKGIDIVNSGDNLKPFQLAGNHNLIEDCKFYNNGDTGFQVSRSQDSKINIDMWPQYNVMRDCESYNNADPSGINADGFGLKLTVGVGNIFERCISHNNIDDGFDAYTKIGEGAIGPVTLVDCVSYDNGNKLNDDGTTTSYNAGGNNGFKMGGESVAVQHYLKGCRAFDNNANGITTNSNPALKIRDFVSYRNAGSGFALYTNTDDGRRVFNYDLKGCVSYKNGSVDKVEAKDMDTYLATTRTIPASIVNLLTADQLESFMDGTEHSLVYSATSPVDVSSTSAIAEYVESSDTMPTALVPYLTATQLAKYVPSTKINSGKSWPIGLNHSTTLAADPTNYFATANAGEGVNSEGEVVTDDFFKSVDKNDVLTKGRYSQNEDGQFILGDFLALATAFAYDANDAVDYPDEPQVSVDDTTSGSATVETTETTTKATTSSSSSYSSGGGGGSASHKASSQNDDLKASYDTSKNKTEDKTTTAKSFVTPSGVVITPPVSTGKNVNFTDIANRAWAVDSINKLAQAGIVNGVSSTSFAPDAYSKRADFIVMLVKAFGLTGATSDNFDDVQAGKYYADSLSIAKTTGIATGYGDGNFGPENTITRQDMMVLVAKALEFAGVELDTNTAVLSSFADSNSIADYAKTYVAALVNAGFATGTDTGIEPTALITRAQMSVLVAKVYDTVLELAESYNAESVEDVTEETSEETSVEDSEDASETATETAEDAE